MSRATPQQAWLAELLGTALLLCAVVGSGIMAERLSAGNLAIALLANTAATVCVLFVLIEALGPISGAHFNPLVTLWAIGRKDLPTSAAAPYLLAQAAGAVGGVWLAHAMFGLHILQASTKLRDGWGQWLAEGVATAGLVLVIQRAPAGRASALVAAWIGAAYWFTASTSFANPAAVLGRMLSDSFAGIAPPAPCPLWRPSAWGPCPGLGWGAAWRSKPTRAEGGPDVTNQLAAGFIAQKLSRFAAKAGACCGYSADKTPVFF
jgi:glycerol uptake facilitator-like aquaporin